MGLTSGLTFPGESAAYRAVRDRLLEDEIELRRATERVAAARRALPPGGVVPEDYLFRGAGPDGGPTDLRLSDLFGAHVESVAIYHYMFPRHHGDDRPAPATGPLAALPLEETPCPSCTALLDQFHRDADGTIRHSWSSELLFAPSDEGQDPAT